MTPEEIEIPDNVGDKLRAEHDDDLLDQFAGMAMQTLLSKMCVFTDHNGFPSTDEEESKSLTRLSARAYKVAAAMLARRKAVRDAR